MTEIIVRKAGISTGQIGTPASACQSEAGAIKARQAECLMELIRLKRKTQEMEKSHAQVVATIEERDHAAQENFKAAEARLHARMAKIGASNVNPACEFSPGTHEMEQARQRKKMNFLVFIIQAVLFGAGIVAVGILLLTKRTFHQRGISCGKIHYNRPVLGQAWLNPANFY